MSRDKTQHCDYTNVSSGHAHQNQKYERCIVILASHWCGLCHRELVATFGVFVRYFP